MKFFDKLADGIIKSRWYLFGIFIALTIAGLVLSNFVGVNYDLSKYLPENSKTKIALQVMEDEFGASGTASILIGNCTAEQAYELSINLRTIEGVATTIFDNTSEYYKDNNALIKVFFASGDYAQETATALDEIRTMCSEYETALGGSAVEATSSRNAISSEMIIILLIAVAIVILILLLTSKSWLEPLVYLIVIGCAILINMGTNIIMGEISFITDSISAIMLIALEMDYCIVLCSRFREEQAKGKDDITAMRDALSHSFTAIIASSCTVMAGLVALMFMDYTIGFDIGAVLAKGVFISILAVIFFMPSIILMFSKLLRKTAHRSFLPKMDKIGTFANKTRHIIPVLFVGLVVAGAVLQSNVGFTYVADSVQKGSSVQLESQKIEEQFGKQNSLVVIIPNGDIQKEMALYQAICDIEIDGQKYINSKSAIVDTELYASFTKETLASAFNLDTETVNSIYIALGKNENDSIYMIELIDYLHKNNTIISSIASQKQANIDALYNGLNQMEYYTMLTATQAQDKYNLTQEGAMLGIYANILKVEPEQVGDTQLPNYAVMYALYTLDIDGYQTTLEPYINNQYTPYTALSQAQIVASYGLPETAVAQIFAIYGAKDDGTIYQLQLIQALNTRLDASGTTIIKQVGAQMQATIEDGYALAEFARSLFCSEQYDRMIFNINLAIDDELAIQFINQLYSVLDDSGYESYFVANNTSNLMDTQEVFKTDRLKTDLITVFAILLIILLAFRSISVPILLVLTIQGAIWINLACNTIAGDNVFFICYLLAMAIQMGATIDYGILLTDRYITFRRKQSKVDALKSALNASINTILSSGLILIFSAFTIHFVSSTPLISEIGLLIGRGALISVIAILFVLPQLLLLFDKVIEKTTKGAKFLNEKTLVCATNANSTIDSNECTENITNLEVDSSNNIVDNNLTNSETLEINNGNKTTTNTKTDSKKSKKKNTNSSTTNK